ncbi:DUF4221 family protein [Litoribacter populi]|uniref:DUF4221 family protein n=1 Tax=Litoribacter populi TaxID=2598460 RepID=UPI0011802BB7|nr:DUF4221 family protein [Litoribacter populi]
MKRLLFPAILLLTIGCTDKDSDGHATEILSLSFELDTVMVDAGDDMIYVMNSLFHASMSDDGKALFNFNNQENLLEVIDMDNLRLSHKIPFEREGPNGTGGVSGFQNLKGGNYLLTNYTSMGIFSEKGQKEYSFDFSKVPEGIFEENETVVPEGIISEDGKSFYTFYAKGWAGSNGIVKLDLETGEMRRTPVDQLKALDRFTIRSHDEYKMEINMVARYISWQNGKLLISNSAENQLLVFCAEGENLFQFDFLAHLTPNQIMELPTRDVDDFEEIPEIFKVLDKDVFFGNWLYDPLKERYYRLTSFFEKEVENRTEYKVVLTVLDSEYNQLYEGLTPLKSKQLTAFVREGKLYTFENIEDELGFVILSMHES